MAKKEKKILSPFIGKQLSRFKLGMSYLTLAMTSITAIMTTKGAFPTYNIEIIIAVLAPVALFGTLFLGYYLDRLDINTQDQRKSNEMTHRYLMTSDIKSQEFQVTQTMMILNALQSLKEGKDIEIDSLMKIYSDYLNKWKSPEENSV